MHLLVSYCALYWLLFCDSFFYGDFPIVLHVCSTLRTICVLLLSVVLLLGTFPLSNYYDLRPGQGCPTLTGNR